MLVAVVWALFVNPSGALSVGDPARLVLELGIFGASVAALASVGHPHLALTSSG